MNTMLCFEGFELMNENELLNIDAGGFLKSVTGAVVGGIAGVCAEKATAKIVGTVISTAVGGPVGYVAGIAVAATVCYIWDKY